MRKDNGIHGQVAVADIAAIIWLTRQLNDWTAEIQRDLKAGFNPSQPRAPEGSPDGGQWVDTGWGP